MQLKRILVSLLVAIMVLSTAVVAVSADDVLTTSAPALNIAVESTSTADVAAGDTVEVNVVIKNNPGIRCLQFDLTWDADLVTPVTGADGKVAIITSDIFKFEDSFDLGFDSIVVGEEKISFISDMGNRNNVTETGTVVTLSFKVNDNYKCSDGSIVIAVVSAFALDANDEGCTASVTNFEIVAHSFADVAEVSATCTEDGATAGKKCTVCGTVVGVDVIPATGHNYTAVAAVPATCTTTGTTAGEKCATCGETKDITEVSALGHTEETYGEKNDGIRCSVCGEIIKEASEPANLLWLWIVLAVVVVAAVAVVVFVVIKKKK